MICSSRTIRRRISFFASTCMTYPPKNQHTSAATHSTPPRTSQACITHLPRHHRPRSDMSDLTNSPPIPTPQLLQHLEILPLQIKLILDPDLELRRAAARRVVESSVVVVRGRRGAGGRRVQRQALYVLALHRAHAEAFARHRCGWGGVDAPMRWCVCVCVYKKQVFSATAVGLGVGFCRLFFFLPGEREG